MKNLPFRINPNGVHPHLCRCQTLGCRRTVINLGDGRTARHCWDHATLEEKDAFWRYWADAKMRQP